MRGICVKQAQSMGSNGYFLELGKTYDILSEDSIGYWIPEHGWISKEHLSIQEFREYQIKKVLDDTILEM